MLLFVVKKTDGSQQSLLLDRQLRTRMKASLV